jgi:hypothetical protein
MMVLDRILTWFRSLPGLRGRQAVRAYGILGAGLFLFGGVVALAYNYVFLPQQPVAPNVTATVAATPKPQEARDIPGPLNGLFFTATEAKTWQGRHPLAVIIENHLDARPQSGLSQADVVYEALAEGGITRQLALYLTNLSPVYLGPIRSMRTYFLDWLEEVDGLAVHVGGNMDALDRIHPEGVKDLDQFGLGAPTYQRTTDRYAPHNVYTSTDRLWAAAASRGFTGSSNFQSWPFKNEAMGSARPSSQILRLSFLGDPNYKVVWTYEPATNFYLKAVGGVNFIDRNNNQVISAKTVVVQVASFVNSTTRIGESTLVMADIGSGKAYVFTDGVVTPATWSKKSRTDRTTFVDKSGAEVPFNRGQIWIEVVPPTSTVDF